MSSQKQIDANRRNSALSTGPRTEEGKATSRQNSLQHGMTATIVTPPTQESAQRARFQTWSEALKPETCVEVFQVNLAVAASLRIELCHTSESERRAEIAELAMSADWDTHRLIEAYKLGDSLKRNPALVLLKLRLTPAGRDWLIMQWKQLLVAFSGDGVPKWTDTEYHVALDLLGVPKTLRDARTDLQNTFYEKASSMALILDEIAKLEVEQLKSEAQNAKLRKMHIQGSIHLEDASLKLIRRYERESIRSFERALKALEKSKPKPVTIPAPAVTETKPIPVVAVPVVAVSNVEPTQSGNRLYRRKQQKAMRHQEYLSRTSA